MQKMPNLKKRKSNTPQYCENCGKDVGFSYVNKRFCDERCIAEWRKKVKYHRRYRPKEFLERKCLLCNKLLIKGERKSISKFCSKRCMNINTKVRKRNQKSIYIRIPIKDIPRLFK